MEEDQTLRFSLRLPKDLHERATASADANNNSLNAEFLRLLTVGLDKERAKEPDRTLVDQLLSPATIWRVDRFQQNNSLLTREEAVKRLVKIALDDTESAKDILDKLAESYKSERDLRILARDVIAAHAAVESLSYGQKGEFVWFKTKAGESGAINRKGELKFSEDGSDWDSYMQKYIPLQKTASSGGWDSGPGRGGDLDDEIPF